MAVQGPSQGTVPASARIGRIEVGVTTMDQLESWFGKGREFTGMHPHGGREWYSKPTGWYLSADGFNYKDGHGRQRMVERFAISTRRSDGAFDDADTKTPGVSVGRSELGTTSAISLGMERSKVLILLKHMGIKPAVTNNVISWNEAGYHHVCDAAPNHDQLDYTNWEGQLTFHRDQLQEIYVECW